MRNDVLSAYANMRFDQSYEELDTLADGQRIRFRLVRPTDKELLSEGLAGMSPESRYTRFMGAKDRLSKRELAYLTEVDGHDHFALGALAETDGEQRGVGIARFVRLPGEPDVAEPAITVVDAFQGKGLGRKLLNRLVSAARERGVERFRADFLASNTAIRALLDDVSRGAPVDDQGETATMEFALPHPSLGEQFVVAIRSGDLYRAFVRVAAGLLPHDAASVLDSERGDKEP